MSGSARSARAADAAQVPTEWRLSHLSDDDGSDDDDDDFGSGGTASGSYSSDLGYSGSGEDDSAAEEEEAEEVEPELEPGRGPEASLPLGGLTGATGARSASGARGARGALTSMLPAVRGNVCNGEGVEQRLHDHQRGRGGARG
jgi:hypothetical protein